jgi:hypothetical protein
MAALGIRWEAHLVKASRLDFAVDLLASGFEPARPLILAPAAFAVDGPLCAGLAMRHAIKAWRFRSGWTN